MGRADHDRPSRLATWSPATRRTTSGSPHTTSSSRTRILGRSCRRRRPVRSATRTWCSRRPTAAGWRGCGCGRRGLTWPIPPVLVVRAERPAARRRRVPGPPRPHRGRGAAGAGLAAPAARPSAGTPTNERTMSEALQRSLLTPPVQQPGLQVAVRYLPASHDAQIGGDWYDAFTVRDGALALAIGDVTGHDREAAAEMGAGAQPDARNRLHARRAAERDHGRARRGDPRAAGRHQRHRRPGQGRAGTRRAAGHHRLRWTVAGHLPPVLLSPSGEVRYLDSAAGHDARRLAPDPAPTTTRCCSSPGRAWCFYTDGLVERRRRLAARYGMDWLAGRLADWAGAGRRAAGRPRDGRPVSRTSRTTSRCWCCGWAPEVRGVVPTDEFRRPGRLDGSRSSPRGGPP